MRKIIERGLCLISCLFMLWLFVSWAEVVSKNLTPNPTYSSWNALVILSDPETAQLLETYSNVLNGGM